jgi:hypothetical protein
MLMLTTEMPVDLAILDNGNEAVARLTATLCDLHGEWAALTISEQPGATCLRWGARVRFWIPDGAHVYEATGSVVEHRLIQNDSTPTDAQEPSTGQRETIIRLSECRTLPQRRVMPRRTARFAVQYRLLTPCDDADMVFDTMDAETQDIDVWQAGWCVDIGAGGLRLRTDRRDSWPSRLALQFNLPASADRSAPAASPFRLIGRVLRTAPVRSRVAGVEVVIAFENLPVREGVRLSAFLRGSLHGAPK